MLSTNNLYLQAGFTPESTKNQTLSNVAAIIEPYIVRKLREGKGLTRQALAKQIDCSPQAIVNYEKTGSKLTIDKYALFLMAIAYDDQSLKAYSEIFKALNSQVAQDLEKSSA